MITLFNNPKKEINLSKFIGRGGRFLILKEVKKKNIDCQVIMTKREDKEDLLYIRLKKGGKTRWISPQRGYFNSKLSCELALYKDLTYQVLRSINLPVPNSVKIERLKQLKDLSLSYPLVVKPTAQAKGKDVLVGLEDEVELRKICKKLLKKYSSLLVEEFIHGNDFRLLILDNKLLAAVERIPPKVKGDGKKTIEKLIEISNTKRHDEPESFRPFLKTLEIDSEIRRCLRKQGFNLKSILPEGKVIKVRQNANFATGGRVEDITDKVHPDNIKLARRAVKALGLKLGGVDIITKDITQSIRKNHGKILEVNGIPGLWIHHFPNRGKGKNIARRIINYLFEN
ncbi:MAG: hypothetical protein ABH831_02960 [Candidatus Nealsonbacteria bacterium]